MSGYVTIFRTAMCCHNNCQLYEYIKMAVRVHFEGNNEVGVFSALTNAYCLVAIGGSQNFYR